MGGGGEQGGPGGLRWGHRCFFVQAHGDAVYNCDTHTFIGVVLQPSCLEVRNRSYMSVLCWRVVCLDEL